jgi:hypothetical protein
MASAPIAAGDVVRPTPRRRRHPRAGGDPCTSLQGHPLCEARGVERVPLAAPYPAFAGDLGSRLRGNDARGAVA